MTREPIRLDDLDARAAADTRTPSEMLDSLQAALANMVAVVDAAKLSAHEKAAQLRQMLNDPLVKPHVKKLRVTAIRCPRGNVLAEVYRVPQAKAPDFDYLVMPTPYSSRRGDAPAWALKTHEPRNGYCRCCPGAQTYTIADGLP